MVEFPRVIVNLIEFIKIDMDAFFRNVNGNMLDQLVGCEVLDAEGVVGANHKCFVVL